MAAFGALSMVQNKKKEDHFASLHFKNSFFSQYARNIRNFMSFWTWQDYLATGMSFRRSHILSYVTQSKHGSLRVVLKSGGPLLTVQNKKRGYGLSLSIFFPVHLKNSYFWRLWHWKFEILLCFSSFVCCPMIMYEVHTSQKMLQSDPQKYFGVHYMRKTMFEDI